MPFAPTPHKPHPDGQGLACAALYQFVLFIPLIGVLVYLIARGGSMGERSAARAQQ
jgi:hypothetical protein